MIALALSSLLAVGAIVYEWRFTRYRHAWLASEQRIADIYSLITLALLAAWLILLLPYLDI